MKCQICGKIDALNFYGVIVLEDRTEVGTARWGQNISAARDRAKEEVRGFAKPGEFIYSVFAVLAHNRREVVKAYEV